MRRVERHGRAMGSTLHVVVWAPASVADRLADLAVRRVELLESCWSRFRDESELVRLNARAGSGAVVVSDDLLLLVRAMQECAAWTEGAVDATVLPSMVSLGYDRDFATVATVPAASWVPRPGAGMADVVVEGSSVTLPHGVGLDPGAIGKGLAGDIVTGELSAAGASAVMVSLGGDVVTHGVPPDADAWSIAMLDDRCHPPEECRALRLSGEQRAVATSSTLRRRWAGRHHIVDPLTGEPVRSDIAQCSVVADCGWRAEAAATLAIVRGSSSLAWLTEQGCTAYALPHEVGAHA